MLSARRLRRLHVGPVDFTVESGGCLAIRGASGAGKSVLLRMVADLDPHDGEVLLDDMLRSALPAPAWRRQVTYVAADAGWWLSTVGEHFTGRPDVAGALPSLGLPEDAMSWPVARLSTGESQRLSLLRALQPGTRALLLDEPTSGLDPDNVALVEAFLAARRHEGLSIVIVTHDAAQADRLASQSLLLADGRLHDAA